LPESGIAIKTKPIGQFAGESPFHAVVFLKVAVAGAYLSADPRKITLCERYHFSAGSDHGISHNGFSKQRGERGFIERGRIVEIVDPFAAFAPLCI